MIRMVGHGSFGAMALLLVLSIGLPEDTNTALAAGPPDTVDALELPVPRTFDLAHVAPDHFAAALGKDPERIFAFVRDQIGYEVYTGALRGPRGTLLAMAGNSVDRAALLASLLKESGHRVQFVRGTLPKADAEKLVDSMWAERAPPAPAEAEGEPSPAVKAALDTLIVGVKRDYTLIREHLKKANISPSAEAAPSLESLVKEAQPHYWVQWWKDGTWVEADPSFADSTPGRKYAPIAETFDALPDSLFHRVNVRVRLEEYSVLLKGDEQVKPARRDILTYAAKAVDLSGIDLVLSHQPENWKGPATSLQEAIASGITSTGRVKPVLLVGDHKWISGEAFRQKPPTGAGIGSITDLLGGSGTRKPVPVATAEWLEFEFIAPDGRKETVVREIFDLVGKARRAAGRNLTSAEVRTRSQASDAFDIAQGVYSLFFTTGRLDSGHISNAAEAPAIDAQREVDVGMLLRRFNILFTVVSDALVGRFAQSDETVVLFYQDSTRLSIMEISSGPQTRRLALDLRRDQARAAAFGRRPEFVVPARIMRGVIDGTLEGAIMDYVRAHMPEEDTGMSFSLSTSTLFARAQTEGVPMIMLPNENNRLAPGLPENTLARLQDEFSDGNVVLAPQRPISVAGGTRFAWWRVNPRTGESVAVTDEGLNQGVTVEYNVVRDRYGQGNYMFYREVTRDAAGNVVRTGRTMRTGGPIPGYSPQWAEIWRDFTQVMQGAIRNPHLRP